MRITRNPSRRGAKRTFSTLLIAKECGGAAMSPTGSRYWWIVACMLGIVALWILPWTKQSYLQRGRQNLVRQGFIQNARQRCKEGLLLSVRAIDDVWSPGNPLSLEIKVENLSDNAIEMDGRLVPGANLILEARDLTGNPIEFRQVRARMSPPQTQDFILVRPQYFWGRNLRLDIQDYEGIETHSYCFVRLNYRAFRKAVRSVHLTSNVLEIRIRR